MHEYKQKTELFCFFKGWMSSVNQLLNSQKGRVEACADCVGAIARINLSLCKNTLKIEIFF